MSTTIRSNKTSPGWLAFAGHDNDGVECVRVLALPQALQEKITLEARAAFPSECCGLIEGQRKDETLFALEAHPVRNLAREPDRFELDPAGHIRILRTLRGTGREIVGCYHSHPNGRAGLSLRDRENAGEDNFVWLVAGIDASGVTGWSCHAANGGVWREIELRTDVPSCA